MASARVADRPAGSVAQVQRDDHGRLHAEPLKKKIVETLLDGEVRGAHGRRLGKRVTDDGMLRPRLPNLMTESSLPDRSAVSPIVSVKGASESAISAKPYRSAWRAAESSRAASRNKSLCSVNVRRRWPRAKIAARHLTLASAESYGAFSSASASRNSPKSLEVRFSFVMASQPTAGEAKMTTQGKPWTASPRNPFYFDSGV